MTNKIYKYIFKLNDALKKNNYSKLNLYHQHLKYHYNLLGGNDINEKINKLEELFNKVKELPNYGINDALENKIKDNNKNFEEIENTMKDLLKDVGLEEKIQKIFKN
jgi:uncharacterized protein YoxC